MNMNPIQFLLAAIFVLIVTQSSAQVIYLKPSEVTPFIIGQQLGEAATSIAAARTLSIQRQSKIVALRSSLSSCGNCSSAAEIQKQLDRSVQNEVDTLRQLDAAVGDKNYAAVMNFVIDPLHLKSDDDAKRLLRSDQREARVQFSRVLRNNYCYATTQNTSDQSRCLSSISMQDFVNNDQLVLNNCSKDPTIECVKNSSVIAHMESAIITQCNLSDPRFALLETADLTEKCKGRSSTQIVTSRVESIRQLQIVSGKDLMNYVSESKIMSQWAEQDYIKTIACKYQVEGTITQNEPIFDNSNIEKFWYGEAPPGIAEMLELESKSSVKPLKDRALGMLSLGSLSVSSCPSTRAEARAIKENSLSSFTPTDEGKIYPAQTIVEGRAIYNTLDRVIFGNNDLINKLIYSKMISCRYFPVEIVKHENYFYWKGKVPVAFPEFDRARIQTRREHPQRASEGDPGLLVGPQSLNSCPATLGEARAQAVMFAQKHFVD